jgi:hypothetical protein
MNGNPSMHRFRLFRSRAFWFGVPGLAALLWGWWVSMGHRSWIDFGGWGIGLSAGELYAYQILDGWPSWPDVEVGQIEADPEEALEWKRMLVEPPQTIAHFHIIFIPYYWPVVGYLATWAGLLIWRKRKYEKRPVE